MFLTDIILNPKNPRLIKDDKFKKLVKSLKDFPKMMSLRPIIIDENNMILGGNMRYKALQELGYKEIPDEWVKKDSELTEEEKREFIVKDNIGFGEWNYELLSTDFDMEQLSEWGMDSLDMGMMEPQKEIIEDDVPEVGSVETRAKIGDIWQLGSHKLLCGDCTDILSVEKLLSGKIVELVFTDPPYRMDVEGGSNQLVGRQAAKLGEKIKHLCDFEPKDFLNVLPAVFEKAAMNAYIFCNKDLVPEYLNWAIHNDYSFNILFWKKPCAIPLGGQHRPDVEYLLFFRKNAPWNNNLKVNYSKMLEFGRENSDQHPTVKPIGLVINEILISSSENKIVYDPFLGSGTTLIACEQSDRVCYGCEISPQYCDVIIKRWEKFTGQQAILLNNI